jgi:hypothetical protein
LRLVKAPALKKRDNKKSHDFSSLRVAGNAAGYGWPLLAAMISALPRREQE